MAHGLRVSLPRVMLRGMAGRFGAFTDGPIPMD